VGPVRLRERVVYRIMDQRELPVAQEEAEQVNVFQEQRPPPARLVRPFQAAQDQEVPYQEPQKPVGQMVEKVVIVLVTIAVVVLEILVVREELLAELLDLTE
jgi:hypothetical protein